MFKIEQECRIRHAEITRNGVPIQMILYTKSEVETLIKTGIVIETVYLIRISREPKNTYQVEFDVPVEKKEQRALLITTRNTPSTWNDGTRVIRYLEGLFPNLKRIIVEMNSQALANDKEG